MKVKILLFGEALNIPKTSVGLGVGLLSVWIDGQGFTSGSNDLGALGYILLETQTVDLGDVTPQKQALFSNLHGRVVKYDIKPEMFFRNGGIAKISLTISEMRGGLLVDEVLQVLAEDCTGVSVVTNALSFSCTMFEMEKAVAESNDEQLVSDDLVETAVNDAPAPADSPDDDTLTAEQPA